jgi:hypothetical protein
MNFRAFFSFLSALRMAAGGGVGGGGGNPFMMFGKFFSWTKYL